MDFLVYVLIALFGYLIGSISFAVIIGKIFYKKDVRNSGSKNAGATNVLRTFGKKAAIAVAVGDLLKGIVAFLIAEKIGGFYGNAQIFGMIAGFAAVLGHNFPVYFNFKGGKGILTSLAISFMIDYRAAAVTLVIAIIIIITTKYVSLGSILGCLSNILLIAYFAPNDYSKIIFISLLAVLAIIKHKSNIIRLIKGQERKITKKTQ